MGDADHLGAAFLVGLGPAQAQEQPGGLVLEVGQVEVDQLGAAQRAGMAEQGDRGVPDPDRPGPVDVVEELPQLGHRERAGLSPCPFAQQTTFRVATVVPVAARSAR